MSTLDPISHSMAIAIAVAEVVETRFDEEAHSAIGLITEIEASERSKSQVQRLAAPAWRCGERSTFSALRRAL